MISGCSDTRGLDISAQIWRSLLSVHVSKVLVAPSKGKRWIFDAHYKEIVLFTINGKHAIYAKPSNYIETYLISENSESGVILYNAFMQ